MKAEDDKLYIAHTSKMYGCESKKENDCILTVRKLEGGRVTRYEPRSKSGDATTPWLYAREREFLPKVLVNYLHGLNIAACN